MGFSLYLRAGFIAMAVRNAMENFHCKHLTDEQMAELNPLIRDAIYTALWAEANYEDSEECRQFVNFQIFAIPKYWELPKFWKRFLSSLREGDSVFYKKAIRDSRNRPAATYSYLEQVKRH